MHFTVEKPIFQHFPQMKIVVAVARGLGAPTDTTEIASKLTEAWLEAGSAATAFGNAQSHPNIKIWGEYMRRAGAPRKKFPASIEALVRRAGKGGSPPSINPLVDLYNAISLKYLVPAGGFDLDALTTNLELRYSREGDHFLALDSETGEAVPPKEICYADASQVITRHFVWKQSKHAILKSDSSNIILVSEVLGEVGEETALSVAHAFSDGLERYWGVKPRIHILDIDTLNVELSS
jgi:DNA/RNA-binding domain of Phe-tRNA-synthetase-like protein